jgi:hypothetical protein
MKFMRVILGLAIGAIGFVAALVMLMVFLLFFPVDDTLVVRLGWAVIVALVEGLIFVVTSCLFRKVMGRMPRHQDGVVQAR